MIATTIQDVKDFFSLKFTTLAADTETSGTNIPLGDYACGFSFAYRDGNKIHSIYIPLRHEAKEQASLFDGGSNYQNLDIVEVSKIVKPVLENPKLRIVGHHIKFDMQVFWKEGIDIANPHCTMIMSNLLDSRRPNGLKALMKILLNEHHTEQSELFMYMKHYELGKAGGYAQLPIDVVGPYAAKDADATLRLDEILYPQMKGLERIYLIERRVIRVLAEMESRGMPADKEFLETTEARLRKAVDNVSTAANKLMGREIDLGKNELIAYILYDELGIPIPKLGPGKTPTDKSALEKIEHPFARLVICYRQLSKLASTYFGPMSKMVSKTGRIHTSFQQVKSVIEGIRGEEGRGGTDTGRLAAVKPNLQNITARRTVYKNGKPETVDQTLVRRAFRVPDDNWQFLMFDYNQMELRLLAHESEDPTLVAAFTANPPLDVHTITASRVFVDKWIKATKAGDKEQLKSLRSKGKNINFGIIYGMGADRLASELGLIEQLGPKKGVEEARRILDTYFQEYPGVKELDRNLKSFLKKYGYIETMFGRRRVLEAKEEYKALNTRVQGGCLHGSSLIETPSGFQTIECLFNTYSHCVSSKTETLEIISMGAKHNCIPSYQGRKNVNRYYFTDGTSLIATPDHKVKVLKENMKEDWVPIGKLTENDFVIGTYPTVDNPYQEITVEKSYSGNRACNKKHSYNISIKITEDIGWLLGMLVGDGSYSGDEGGYCIFSKREEDNALKTLDIMQRILPDYKISKTQIKNGCFKVASQHTAFVQILRSCGLHAVTAKNKSIPEVIWRSPISVIRAFVNGLYTSDGGATHSAYSYTTTSETLAFDIGNILHLIGIDSHISFRGDGAFNICVGKDKNKFRDEVGVTGKWKNDIVSKYINFTKIPRPAAEIPNWLSVSLVSNTSVSTKEESLYQIKWRVLKKNFVLSRHTALRFVSDSEEYKFLATKYLKRIKKVLLHPETDVFDLTMTDGEPEFIANGTLVHNCADINKIALYNIVKGLKPKKSELVNNIHDEVTILHYLKESYEEIAGIILPAMQDVAEFKVPMIVTPSAAYPTWASKKKI